MLLATPLWATLIVLYAGKWLTAREDALREAEDPIQCCFIGLAGVTTSLAALAVLPYIHALAVVLFVAGALFTTRFAVSRTGRLWEGARDPSTTTPILYLPTVTGAFITTIAAAALGLHDRARLSFGAGFFSWLAIESVLLHRLFTAPALPAPLRPTLGIQLAPSAAGAVTCLSVTTGLPDLATFALLDYALFQAMVLLLPLPWIRRQPFGPSFSAFSFGVAELSTASLRVVERDDTGVFAMLAVPIFVAANVVMLVRVAGTVPLAITGRLLPGASVATREPDNLPMPAARRESSQWRVR